MIALFDRSAARFEGEDRGIVEVARAVLLHELGRDEDAARQVDAAEARWGEAGPRMPPAIASARRYVT
jgi:hypothetical protein